MSDLGRELQTIGTAANAIDNSGRSWEGGHWFEQLQPGSWRGVGFVMDMAQTSGGRRTALHEYPYRDSIWVEDLGKLPRRYVFQAFLTGDDVYQRRDAMLAACEKPGQGTLVHPTLGSLTVVLLDARFTDRRDRGRYIEIQFAFIDYDPTVLPTRVTSTGDNVSAAADGLDEGSAADLSRGVNTAGAGIPTGSTNFVSDFARLSINAVNDPARALSAVTGLQGYFGRYSTGRRSTLLPVTATVDSALADSISTRGTVLAAADALTAAVEALG